MSNFSQTLFERFDRRPRLYLMCLLGLYLFINNTINASSDWMEATRHNTIPEFNFWEPFAWEYTSALSTLLLLPLLAWWFTLVPFSLERFRRFILLNFVATFVFSALHVSLMVLFRELIYSIMGGNYDFGAIYTEFLYEYRKDAWGFVFFMALYYVYLFIYSRLKGEASLISEQPQTEQEASPANTANATNAVSNSETQTPEHLLIKKLDKEFLVKVTDIDWLEAAGNYVNLHAGGRIYPLRSTLASLIPRLACKDFMRIHRSYGVNLNRIESITPLPSGDAEVRLLSGQTLSLSRRYKEAFRDKVK